MSKKFVMKVQYNENDVRVKRFKCHFGLHKKEFEPDIINI